MIKNLLRHTISAKFLLIAMLSFGVLSFTPDYEHPATTKTIVTKYYPNPATSFITFEFQKDIDRNYSLQVYNFLGRKMYESPVNSGKITVELNGFNRGMYFFQLRNRGGQILETGKFQVIK